MSTVTTEDGTGVPRRGSDDGPLRSVPITDNGDAHAASTSRQAVFVIPRRRPDGFHASIRGRILDLVDPSCGHTVAPTPDDLFVVAIASDLAWSARSLLRASGLPDYVCVSANWATHDDLPSLADINLTVTVSRTAETVRAALAAEFANSLAARSLAEPAIHISFEGENR